MEPMKGKWASSRVDLGYTELFCIPEVHQCSSGFVTVFLGTLWCSIKKIEAPYMFDWEYGIACMQCRGIEPHFPASGISHTNSRVAPRTWGTYASYSGDGHSKLHFVQRSQDTRVVMRDTSGLLTRLGRIIQKLLEVSWETKSPFLVSTEILGFQSIFKKSQASSAFEALNSTSLSRCQGM